jgi:Pyruvate kinase, barrel domain
VLWLMSSTLVLCAGHFEVLHRFRKVCQDMAAETSQQSGVDVAPTWAVLLDTKGPEIRSAMLKDGAPLDLRSGQTVIVEAVGDRYKEWHGYQTEAETRIGVSYSGLCTSVSAGDTILLADGSVSIIVDGTSATLPLFILGLSCWPWQLFLSHCTCGDDSHHIEHPSLDIGSIFAVILSDSELSGTVVSNCMLVRSAPHAHVQTETVFVGTDCRCLRPNT